MTRANVPDWIVRHVEEQLGVVQHFFAAWLDSAEQGKLSIGLALLGTCLTLRGFVLVKPTFVVSLSLALAVHVQEVAATQQSGTAGGICAVLVAACSCVLAHRLYPVALFLVGASAGGLGTILLCQSLNLEHASKELLAISILVAVPGGLLLKEFRLTGWRFLTPAAGAYLLATSCQYWEGSRATWSAASSPSLLFITIWGLATLLGWYCQLIGPAFGEDPCSLPAPVSCSLLRFHDKFPFLLDDEGPLLARPSADSRAFLSEPFLRGARGAEPDAAAWPGFRRGWSRAPKLLVGFSVVIVLLLNSFLISQPLLVLGHAVLMSLAFLPLTTAGLLSYKSESCFRSRSGVMESLLRHAAHATLGMLVLLCALLGCLSMYWKKLLSSEHGSSPTWSGGLHALVGYATLLLLLICSCSGAAKLLAAQKGDRQQDVAPYHALLGKLIYTLAVFNQVQGFFLPGLLPLGMALLLTVLVMTFVMALLAFLCCPSSSSVPAAPFEKAAPAEDGVRHVQLLGRLGDAVARAVPSGRRRKRARQEWDAVVEAFETQDAANMVSLCFLRWHRFAQSAHIAKAHAELQSSDNLVHFLSSTLLGEMSQTRERVRKSHLTWCPATRAMLPGRPSVRDHGEKELMVEESVDSLGFGFVDLPPTKYAPVVIKTVKKDSWAADAGILAGSELLELNGQEAGRMSADDFRATLKQRPLRVRLAPPMAEAWKQVANFQQQVVALSLHKVHLQQALKDESDRVKKELGICTATEKSNSLQHKAQRIKDMAQRDQERQTMEERLAALQAELDMRNGELEALRRLDAKQAGVQSEASSGPLAEAADSKAGDEANLSRRLADLERENAQLQETKAALDADHEALKQEKLRIANERSDLEALRAQLEAKASAQDQREAELERKEASVREELERLESLAVLEVVEEELSKARASLLSAQPSLRQLLEAEVEDETQSASSSSPRSPRRPSSSPSRSSQRLSQTSTRMSLARQSLTAARLSQLRAAAPPVQETADEDSDEMF
ncbi:unnamed protein product [Symbiodinium natans]|uniref:PDZ domain-containing protein n=1 Tax=Symbiodinium natans TaxID=878477 RepID=A0A812UUD7_9DINO|nr:unnamed protein product [Symbiodinium natans]